MKTVHHDQASETLDTSSGDTPTRPSRDARETAAVESDPMSDVLETIHLQGAVFFLWEPTWPYATGVADGKKISRHILPGADRIVSYHIVTRGPCWGAIKGEPPLRLETGDILVLPHGDAYKISNEPLHPGSEDESESIEFFRLMAAGDIPPIVTGGGPGPERNGLICGFLGCDMHPYNPLLASLPGMIRVPAPESHRDPLSPLIEFALTESKKNQGGERCLLKRLSEVMFIEVLRRYLRTCPTGTSGWLDGLRHPVIGRALSLLHTRVDEPWTLQKLAGEIGTSRSTLVEKFTRIIGEPPMQYLVNWRMQIAASRLCRGPVKVCTVAHELGYESESTFSRAFKRVAGCSPKAWREQHFKKTNNLE